MSTMHCFCWRGKQRANRQGFHFSVPTEFSSGWPWAQHWLDLYNQVPEKDRQHCGLCFDRRGRAWALSEVTRVAQEIFSDSMADTSQLKSYSFRRWSSGPQSDGAERPRRLASQGGDPSRCHNAFALFIGPIFGVDENEAPPAAMLSACLRVRGLGSHSPFSAQGGLQPGQEGP